MPKGHLNSQGTLTVTCAPENGDKLLSPDKQYHYLPCEACHTMHWKALNVVSFVCDACAKQRDC